MGTLLSVIQDFCGRVGQPVPATVMGTSDSSALQMKSILTEVGEDLTSRGDWEFLIKECSHTTLAQEDQGSIATIAAGFHHIIEGSFFDRTNLAEVKSVPNGIDWQRKKTSEAAGPRYNYRIRGGKLIAYPVPAAGYSWYFEYVSDKWITSADGSTYKSAFTLDTDVILFKNSLITSGLKWAWKKEKGLEYAEDFRAYEIQVAAELARTNVRGKLNLGCDTDDTPIARYTVTSA